jgi:hypothetical protein
MMRHRKIEIWYGISENIRCIDVTVWTKVQGVHSRVKTAWQELEESLINIKYNDVIHIAHYGLYGEPGAGYIITWSNSDSDIFNCLPWGIFDRFDKPQFRRHKYRNSEVKMIIGVGYADKELLENTDNISEAAFNIIFPEELINKNMAYLSYDGEACKVSLIARLCRGSE